MSLLQDSFCEGVCRSLVSTISRAMGEVTVLGDYKCQFRNDKLSRLRSIRVSLSYLRLKACVSGAGF